jgi:hypothetical protein
MTNRLSAALLILMSSLLGSDPSPATPRYAAPFVVADPDARGGGVLSSDLNGDGVLDVIVDSGRPQDYSDNAGARVLLGNGDGTFGRWQALTGAPTALGDLNGDTYPDLVLLRAGSIGIRLNYGDGSFLPEVSMSGGATSVSLADLNGDGRLDLAYVAGGSLTTRLGNGDGTFAGSFASHPTTANPAWIAFTRLDEDGAVDALVATHNNVLSVFRGNGDGTFQPRVDHPAQPGAAFVTTGDFDNDSHQDAVTVSPTSAQIYLGTGSAALSALPPFAVPGTATTAVVADFDGDANADVAVAYHFETVSPYNLGGRMAYFPGDGTGTFGGVRVFDAMGESGKLAATGDVDLDGRLDVLAGNSVLLGNGNGTFGVRRSFEIGPDPEGCDCRDVAVADLDHDSQMDVVVTTLGSSTISVLLANGPNTFAPPVPFPTGDDPFRLAIGHLNGDAHPDVATSNAAGSVSVLMGNGDGTFQPRQDYDLALPIARSIALGDLYANGFTDVVTTTTSPSSSTPRAVEILRGFGDGTFAHSPQGLNTDNPGGLALADMDRDGDQDIVVSMNSRFGDGVILGMLSNANGSFQVIGLGNSYQGGLTDVALGDFDSDGWVDAALRGNLGVEVFQGGRTPQGAFHDPFLVHVAEFLTDLEVADVNRDAALDIAALGNNSVTLIFGSGIGTFHTKEAYGVGINPISFDLMDSGGPALDVVSMNSFHPLAVHAITLLRSGPGAAGVPVAVTPSRIAVRGHPNPTRSTVTVELTLPASAHTSLRVYDLAGRCVRTLVDRPMEPGMHPTVWDLRDSRGRRVAAGVYLYVARSGGDEVARRVVVIP